MSGRYLTKPADLSPLVLVYRPLTPPSSPSQLFGNNPLSHTLPVTVEAESTAGAGPLYYVAGTSASKPSTRIFKAAVYNSTAPVPVSIRFENPKGGGGGGKGKEKARAKLTVLTGPKDPYGVNDPFTRVNVVKETKTDLVAGDDGAFTFSLPELSVAVLETTGAGGRRGIGRDMA